MTGHEASEQLRHDWMRQRWLRERLAGVDPATMGVHPLRKFEAVWSDEDYRSPFSQ